MQQVIFQEVTMLVRLLQVLVLAAVMFSSAATAQTSSLDRFLTITRLMLEANLLRVDDGGVPALRGTTPNGVSFLVVPLLHADGTLVRIAAYQDRTRLGAGSIFIPRGYEARSLNSGVEAVFRVQLLRAAGVLRVVHESSEQLVVGGYVAHTMHFLGIPISRRHITMYALLKKKVAAKEVTLTTFHLIAGSMQRSGFRIVEEADFIEVGWPNLLEFVDTG